MLHDLLAKLDAILDKWSGEADATSVAAANIVAVKAVVADIKAHPIVVAAKEDEPAAAEKGEAGG